MESAALAPTWKLAPVPAPVMTVWPSRSAARSAAVLAEAPTTVNVTPRLPKLTVSEPVLPMVAARLTVWLLPAPSDRVTLPPAVLVIV